MYTNRWSAGVNSGAFVRGAMIGLCFIAACDRPDSAEIEIPPVEPTVPPLEHLGATPPEPGVQTLSAASTTRISTACTLYIRPSGNDKHSGRTPAEALRTPARAVSLVHAGEVVCFDSGAYPPLVVEDVHGTPNAPVVFRSLPDTEATFSSGNLSDGASVFVARSEFVHLYDLHVSGSQSGVVFASSSYGRVEGLHIDGLGQAGIAVGRSISSGPTKHFLGPASHHIDVIGNTIRDTGKVTARYGEGVYIGTGGLVGDDTYDIFVAYNTIDHVRAEGIEIKAYTHDIIVRGNTVAHASHLFHAGITVGVTPRPCEGAATSAGREGEEPCTVAAGYSDGKYLIEDNLVCDYQSTGGPVAGIGVGHGNTIVRNNVIANIPGGSGIQTYATFGNHAAASVLIDFNTISNPAGRGITLHESDEGTGVIDQLSTVTLTANDVRGAVNLSDFPLFAAICAPALGN